LRTDPAVEAELFTAIDRFFDHVADRRLEDTLACFAPDDDVALYGSEVSETVIGADALRRFFECLYRNSVGPRFRFGNRRATVRGEVAWFTAEAEVAIAEQMIAPYRLTGILEYRGGKWFWRHFHGSEPQPDRT
jgi:hypothetical protein